MEDDAQTAEEHQAAITPSKKKQKLLPLAASQEAASQEEAKSEERPGSWQLKMAVWEAAAPPPQHKEGSRSRPFPRASRLQVCPSQLPPPPSARALAAGNTLPFFRPCAAAPSPAARRYYQGAETLRSATIRKKAGAAAGTPTRQATSPQAPGCPPGRGVHEKKHGNQAKRTRLGSRFVRDPNPRVIHGCYAIFRAVPWREMRGLTAPCIFTPASVFILGRAFSACHRHPHFNALDARRVRLTWLKCGVSVNVTARLLVMSKSRAEGPAPSAVASTFYSVPTG
jgi:hypothetical protein